MTKIRGQLVSSTRWCPVCKRYRQWYWFPKPIRKAYCAKCFSDGLRIPLKEDDDWGEDEDVEKDEDDKLAD